MSRTDTIAILLWFPENNWNPQFVVHLFLSRHHSIQLEWARPHTYEYVATEKFTENVVQIYTLLNGPFIKMIFKDKIFFVKPVSCVSHMLQTRMYVSGKSKCRDTRPCRNVGYYNMVHICLICSARW